jgi:hypothetical protein
MSQGIDDVILAGQEFPLFERFHEIGRNECIAVVIVLEAVGAEWSAP